MVTRTAEPELYKDKIEVSLDGRQIFYLFFGGAVVACLVFVLGVMVGRRLEARAHVDRAAMTSATRDPLAALDRLAEGKGEMTFPAALGNNAAAAPVTAVDRAIQAVAEPAPDRDGKDGKDGKDAAKDSKDAKKVDDKAAEPAADKKADAAAEKAAAEKAATEKAAAEKAAKAKAKSTPAGDDAAPASKPEPPDGKGQKGKFTLQLSAFQDSAEAEAFLATVKQAGYAAYVVSAEVEGKGTFYRVRLGNYGSYDDAVAAKAEFERKVPKIAYVTRL